MPTAAVHRKFDPLEYREPSPRPALIRALGPVNRHLLLRGLLRIATFELPEADLARLRRSVNPGTAAFLGPNHPEFMTDWLIDKEISRLASPLMAHWASYEIVNGTPLTQRFWLANNLVANAPGGGGKAYSVRWALEGHGVLLHPDECVPAAAAIVRVFIRLGDRTDRKKARLCYVIDRLGFRIRRIARHRHP